VEIPVTENASNVENPVTDLGSFPMTGFVILARTRMRR
jgi:hypothetical protein